MSHPGRISATISDADLTAILGHVRAIAALCPWLVTLTKEEREELPKMGPKTLDFDNKCRDYMAQFPEFVPGFVDPAEAQKDRDLSAVLMTIVREIMPLAQRFEDSAMLSGNEAYASADLPFYQNVKQAARRGFANATTVYDDLKVRFPGNAGSQNQQTTTPAS